MLLTAAAASAEATASVHPATASPSSEAAATAAMLTATPAAAATTTHLWELARLPVQYPVAGEVGPRGRGVLSGRRARGNRAQEQPAEESIELHSFWHRGSLGGWIAAAAPCRAVGTGATTCASSGLAPAPAGPG
jgi:hypothetical protein